MTSGSIITAKIDTWARDSFELLDYDATDITKTTIKSKTSCYMVRTDNCPFFIENPFTEEFSKLKFLSRIQSFDNYFSISPITSINEKKLEREQYEKLWLVVKSMKNKSGINGYFLGEGDVIRIGRCKFRVKDLKNTVENGMENFSLCDMLSGNDDDSEELPHNETTRSFILPCRICLSEVYFPENPLISPCKCGGTMKYIHLKCLQQCLMSKLTTKSSDCVLSFSWKKLGCDLCKKTYPYKLNLQGKTIELLDIPKPPGQYIILEALCKDKSSQKGLHVIHMGNKTCVKIGRAQECELRITDISVSRNHAKINFIGGNFYLEDSGSKFGTLVQIKRPVLIEENKDIRIQSGRSLISYNLKLPWTLIPSCFRTSSSLFDGTLTNKNIPILPFNTGIPLSVSDQFKLLAYAGMPIRLNEKCKQNNNILHEHNELGANSSYEMEDNESVGSVEEVEIANAEEAEEEEAQCEDTNRFEVTAFNS
ncbi:hypothetical protein SteCoe_28747 [Stentor coeruleus]|uniref:FHA domain-containing protein n=1 Tax=Stentor coeruleus TaxID=5963 RepID=A0A1R2B7Z5_9CILI|nr:hypothetical protein SteCoe_28747 [Stentor coeruleus]